MTLIREQLDTARAAGVAFEDAWPSARDDALAAVTSAYTRDEWVEALAATETAWQRAYEGIEPAPFDRAAAMLEGGGVLEPEAGLWPTAA